MQNNKQPSLVQARLSSQLESITRSLKAATLGKRTQEEANAWDEDAFWACIDIGGYWDMDLNKCIDEKEWCAKNSDEFVWNEDRQMCITLEW